MAGPPEPRAATPTDTVDLSLGMWVAVRNLNIDRLTATVVLAFSAAGVQSILLKGPAIERWLYTDAEVRGYVDVDLLVAPTQFRVAEGVLEGLGFQPEAFDVMPDNWHRHARAWVGPGRVSVDLHRTLSGIGVSAEVLWYELSAQTEPMRVGGTEVAALQLPARALGLVLHAAKEGSRVPKVMRDLEHALARVEPQVWEHAAVLARRLDATGAFAAGLRLLPAGKDLARSLELGQARSALVALRTAEGPPALCTGLVWLKQERSWARRVAFLVRRIIPPPAYMRALTPLARTGRLGLLAAYVTRPVWLARRLVPAVLALRRTRLAGEQVPE